MKLLVAPTQSAPFAPFEVALPRARRKNTVAIPVMLKVIAVFLFFPEESSIILGGIRLTAIRVIFLVLAPFLLVRLGRKIAAGHCRFVLSDLFVPAAGLWMIVGPANVVGFDEALAHSGPTILEFCIGYLATRALLSEHGQALSFTDLLCRIIAIVALLGLFDTATHHFFIRDLASRLTGYTKGNEAYSLDILTRMGILRASSSLEHPIGLGLVCAIGFILSANLPLRSRRFTVPACIFGVVISITSAALQGVILAFCLMKYNFLTARIKSRWLIIISLMLFGLLLIFCLIDNPLGFIFRHLIFDQESGYFRLYTWQVAGDALTNSPWFGLGFIMPAEYEIPFTVDSIWLESALTFGIPGAVLIALSIIGAGSLSTSGPHAQLTTAEAKFGTILGILIFLIVFWGFTVHYWGTDWVFIALLTGVRAHLGELGRGRK